MDYRESKDKKIKQSKKNKSRSSDKDSLRGIIKIGLQVLFLILLIVIAIGIIYFYQTFGKELLRIQATARQTVIASTPGSFKETETSLVYDSEGALISALRAEKDVYYIKYEDIPGQAINAMLVSEDRKFLEHEGVDYLANIRALMALIKNKGKITQGASTITQQLARNVFLTHEVTYERKTKEIFLAIEIEKKYSKFDILEYYFNNIYFANGYYGIQAASYEYFGKSISGISLSQLVFLCAIPNNPNLYNPITNLDKTIGRRDRILEQMLFDGMIKQQEYNKAIAEKITISRGELDKKNYVETYVYHSAIKELMKNQGFEFRNTFSNDEDKSSYQEAYDDLYYGIQEDLFHRGYRIYTSIDMDKQRLLQETVNEHLGVNTEVNDEGIYKFQGASVCIDNDNGRVVAIVGGREQEVVGYTLNRAYQSFRQPGSAIKPLIVYTPSFERGYTQETIVVDEKIEDGPSNASNNYSGEMTLQRAIEVSKNTIAWKLFEELTPEVGLSYLLSMNFNKIHANDYFPAASLGGFTVGVSPLEMASAYSTLGNSGLYRDPTCIVKITDAQGNEIIGDGVQTKRIYKEKAAITMTNSLIGVMDKGTAKKLSLENTVSAGKTGTSNDKKDGWFVGYTPYYTTSVWVGYDIPQTAEELSGSTFPGAIWKDYMNEIHTSAMNKTFDLP
ncbi:MAG: glycosyl transferase [Clostridiales bacterium]|nr:glycosyl transferase [Clostridiales bacterium]